MSAARERSRRATAGQRMSSLVGKAAEDDEAFWSHSTWAETGPAGSGSDAEEFSDDASFRESDEDEENRVDTFDSDFDESESDEGDEAEERADEAGLAAEEELRREELVSRRKAAGGAYAEPGRAGSKRKRSGGAVDVASAGRTLLQRKRGVKGKGKAVGDGWNAGLVLNLPVSATAVPAGGAAAAAPPPFLPAAAPVVDKTVPLQPATITAPPPPPAPPTKVAAATALLASPPKPTIASRRTKRSTTSIYSREPPSPSTRSRPSGRQLRAATVTKSIQASHDARKSEKETARRQAEIAARNKKNPSKRRFTQEELLLEAVTTTEAENERWMLSRKRAQAGADVTPADHHRHRHRTGGGGTGGGSGGGVAGTEQRKLVEKFHSRRGCYNTLTFPEMDSVPEILARGGKRGRGDSFTAGSFSRGVGAGVTRPRDDRICIVTGKVARYRDPKTMRGYHDLAAFRELRRRLEAGELLEQESVRPAKKVAEHDDELDANAEDSKKEGRQPLPTTNDDNGADANRAIGSSSPAIQDLPKKEEATDRVVSDFAVVRPKEGPGANGEKRGGDGVDGECDVKGDAEGDRKSALNIPDDGKPTVILSSAAADTKAKTPKTVPLPPSSQQLPPRAMAVKVVGEGLTPVSMSATSVVSSAPASKAETASRPTKTKQPSELSQSESASPKALLKISKAETASRPAKPKEMSKLGTVHITGAGLTPVSILPKELPSPARPASSPPTVATRTGRAAPPLGFHPAAAASSFSAANAIAAATVQQSSPVRPRSASDPPVAASPATAVLINNALSTYATLLGRDGHGMAASRPTGMFLSPSTQPPAAFGFGPSMGGVGTAMMSRALQQGQLAQPPVPFHPGQFPSSALAMGGLARPPFPLQNASMPPMNAPFFNSTQHLNQTPFPGMGGNGAVQLPVHMAGVSQSAVPPPPSEQALFAATRKDRGGLGGFGGSNRGQQNR